MELASTVLRVASHCSVPSQQLKVGHRVGEGKEATEEGKSTAGGRVGEETIHSPPTAISVLGRQLVNAGNWSLGNKISTGCCTPTASLNAAMVQCFFPPRAGEDVARAVEGVDVSSLGVSSSESGESLSGGAVGRRRVGARLTRLAINADGPGSPAAPRTTGRLPDNCVGGGGGGG
jgi:hypothetical protein